MKSEIERPSFWHIRSGLLSSIDFAEDYALRHPEHAAAVRFLAGHSEGKKGVNAFI